MAGALTATTSSDHPKDKPRAGEFRRLLRMLRPYRGAIAFSLLLLIMSSPCEVFPALVWKFVVDDVIVRKIHTPILHPIFSLHGRISDPFHLLASALIWLFSIYLIGE